MRVLDVKEAEQRATKVGGPRGCRGGTALGVLIGFILGVGVAAMVAYAVTRIPNPFDSGRAKTEVAAPHLSSVERDVGKATDKPRFDFSKILPGTEDRKVARADGAPAAERQVGVIKAAEQVSDRSRDDKSATGKFFLQAGAYQNPADAEDQRAKLALMGIEASMQSVEVPEKGTINRVRLGPYASIDEMNQVKAELLKRGVSTAVIRNP